MAVVATSLNVARQYVGEKVLRQLLSYVGKDPRNFPKLLNLAERIAKDDHKEKIAKVRKAYQANPTIFEFVNRLITRTHPNVQRHLVYNWFVNAMLMGVPKQRRMSEQIGANVPNLILVDPTEACNLKCDGCWAGAYEKQVALPFEVVDRICREAKELGIHWIAMSGGEPFIWQHLFALAEKHSDMAFMLYTNGCLINDDVADKLLKVGNISPAFSLEGWKERTDARRGRGVFDAVMSAMDRLRERGCIFGVSITITRQNVQEITSDEFMDFLVGKGVVYGWTFHYIPIGRNPNPELMVTPEQRAYLAERIPHIRTHKPIQIVDFWNDGELTEGCIAGGRRYFHITASGDVEPCAFVHFSKDNIRDKSLVEVLRSPFFRAYQRRQHGSNNRLRPCPIIDVPEALRAIVKEGEAKPTHEGAETVLGGEIGSFLDRRSAEWGEVADTIWEERRPAGATGVSPLPDGSAGKSEEEVRARSQAN